MVIVGVKLTKPAASDAARRVPSFLMSDSSDDANFAAAFALVLVCEGKDAGKSQVKPIIFIARQ